MEIEAEDEDGVGKRARERSSTFSANEIIFRCTIVNTISHLLKYRHHCHTNTIIQLSTATPTKPILSRTSITILLSQIIKNAFIVATDIDPSIRLGLYPSATIVNHFC